MDGNDIIIRVQFWAALLSSPFQRKPPIISCLEDVFHSSPLSRERIRKIAWHGTRRPTTHKFYARWLESKRNILKAHIIIRFGAHSIYRRAFSRRTLTVVQFIGEYFSSPPLLLPSPNLMKSQPSAPTYVVLIMSQHGTEGHKVLGWRCCASTEGWGIFRPQEGRQR